MTRSKVEQGSRSNRDPDQDDEVQGRTGIRIGIEGRMIVITGLRPPSRIPDLRPPSRIPDLRFKVTMSGHDVRFRVRVQVEVMMPGSGRVPGHDHKARSRSRSGHQTKEGSSDERRLWFGT
jgi:hypothetical protein